METWYAFCARIGKGIYSSFCRAAFHSNIPLRLTSNTIDPTCACYTTPNVFDLCVLRSSCPVHSKSCAASPIQHKHTRTAAFSCATSPCCTFRAIKKEAQHVDKRKNRNTANHKRAITAPLLTMYQSPALLPDLLACSQPPRRYVCPGPRSTSKCTRAQGARIQHGPIVHHAPRHVPHIVSLFRVLRHHKLERCVLQIERALGCAHSLKPNRTNISYARTVQ